MIRDLLPLPCHTRQRLGCRRGHRSDEEAEKACRRAFPPGDPKEERCMLHMMCSACNHRDKEKCPKKSICGMSSRDEERRSLAHTSGHECLAHVSVGAKDQNGPHLLGHCNGPLTNQLVHRAASQLHGFEQSNCSTASHHQPDFTISRQRTQRPQQHHRWNSHALNVSVAGI